MKTTLSNTLHLATFIDIVSIQQNSETKKEYASVLLNLYGNICLVTSSPHLNVGLPASSWDNSHSTGVTFRQSSGRSPIGDNNNLKQNFKNIKPLSSHLLKDGLSRGLSVNNVLENRFIDFVKIIVSLKELECWELLGWINENTENFDCFQKLKNETNEENKRRIAQKAVKKLGIILERRNKNRSFKYFLEKINI